VQSDITTRGDTALIDITFGSKIDRAEVGAMAELVEDATETHDELRLLLDLTATDEIAVGAMVSPEGALVSFKSIDPVQRYAVVGAPAIAAGAVELFGKLLPLESRAFDPNAKEEARRWAFAPD
jgi:hypothetical protein